MNKWQRDILEAIDHLRKFSGWILPAEVRRYDRGAVTVGEPGKQFRVFRGGCTWSEAVLAIDASMTRDPVVKHHAILLAKTLGTGWRSIMLAIGDSMAIFAYGRLVGRVRP